MTTPIPENIASIVSELVYRVDGMGRDVKRIDEQLRDYVPARENDLKVQSIKESVARIESDIAEAKKQLTELNTKLIEQEKSQSDLVIGTLRWVLGIVVSIALIGITVWLTHVFG
jgi:hypothetical protein